MKFKKNDFVYHTPTKDGYSVLIVSNFDANRKKYKCYAIDLVPCDDPILSINYMNEAELEPAEDNYKTEYSFLIRRINDEKFDEYYYPVYEYDGTKFTKIRNAIRHFNCKVR